MSFEIQNILILISPIYFFLLLLVLLSSYLRNYKIKCIPIFSPKSFIIFSFKFRSVTHFEIVCIACGRDPTLFFCMWISNCHSNICKEQKNKNYFFPIDFLDIFLSKRKNKLTINWMVDFWTLVMPVTHCLNYVAL